TYHLIGKEEISKMKDGVILVNCARGGIIDENAMLEALKSGKLTGVSLDVFEEEPPPPSELILHPNVITTPHIGASTIEAQKNVSLEVAEQVWLALNGKPVKTAVNMPIPSTKEFDVLKEHILLAETMGKFIYQTSPENLKEVEFEYSGFLTEYNTAILTASFLKGLLSSIVAGNINLINAIPIAKERGIKLKETKGGRDYGLNNLICVRMNTTNPIKDIGGSILPTNEMRIVILNGHRVNMEPFGYILLTKHMDEPGIVGKIGTILGDNNINIASLQLARSKPREEAIMLLSVDEEVKDDVLEKVSKIKGMEYVRFVNLKEMEVK
ncbi:MAG: ACT domain-containing protein, partial [Synergistetes bacterium]|nr:ACT domain-containing protein [Synergistota bacterium]